MRPSTAGRELADQDAAAFEPGVCITPARQAPYFLCFAAILPLAAVILDLRDEVRLAGRGPLARVISLDKVNLAEHLHARLNEERLAHVVRAYHFRRPFYPFGPLQGWFSWYPKTAATPTSGC